MKIYKIDVEIILAIMVLTNAVMVEVKANNDGINYHDLRRQLAEVTLARSRPTP